MADTYSVKKITDLTAKTTSDDTDLYVLGNQGTATMRKITFANLAAKIRDKLTSLTFSVLNTSTKTLPGAINELNSKFLPLSGGTLSGGITTTEGNMLFCNNGYTKGTTPSSDINRYIFWSDKDGWTTSTAGDCIARIYAGVNTSRTHSLYLQAWNPDTASSDSAQLYLGYTTSGKSCSINCETTVTGSIVASNNVIRAQNAGASYVNSRNTNLGNLEAQLHVSASGNHGLYSNGYWNGDSFVTGKNDWIVYRDTAGNSHLKGNAATASKLATARNITIGNKTNSFDGSAAISFSLADIGAQAANTSDPKLKKNITNTKLNAIELVKKIPLHSFDWKADNKRWDVGFIAPELYKIDQNLAIKPNDEEDSYWSVDSFYLIGVLTKAVQELSAEVESLKTQLAKMQTEK